MYLIQQVLTVVPKEIADIGKKKDIPCPKLYFLRENVLCSLSFFFLQEHLAGFPEAMDTMRMNQGSHTP